MDSKFLISLLFVVFTSFSTHALVDKPEVSFNPQPSWVSDTALGALPTQLEKPIHYRLFDRQVNAEDNYASFLRYRYIFSDSAGVQNNSSIRIRFNPTYETLSFHQIHIYRDGKLVQNVGADQIKVLNAEDEQNSNLYSGEFEALVLLKDIRVGDELEYSYTLAGQNPIFKGVFGYFASFGWDVGIDKVTFLLTANKSRNLQVKASNSRVEPIIREQGERQQFSITVNNSEAVLADSDMPSWYSPYPYVQFSQYQDWQQLKKWANTLFENTTVNNPELASYIAKLKAMEKRAALNEAIRFSQDDVRYLGLELGVNSHLPHTPDEVFERRFGDCKDKALLLHVLLKALDIEASPVLVSSIERQEISNYLPTHQVFNHVINRIKFDDKYYFVDATMSYQGRDINTLYQPNYGKALLIDNSQTAVIDATPSTVNSKIEIAEEIIAADYYSPVLWQVTTKMFGGEAESFRYRLATQGFDSVANSYVNYYANSYPSIEVSKEMQVTDDPVANVIKVTEFYAVPDYWQLNEHNEAEFSFYANYGHQYTRLPKSVRRTSPLAVNYPINVAHQISFQMPEDVDFTRQEYSENISDEYIRFSSQFRYDKKRLILTNHYQSMAPYVPANAVAKHITKLKKIGDYAGYSGSITNVIKGQSDVKFEAMLEKLKQLSNKGSAH